MHFLMSNSSTSLILIIFQPITNYIQMPHTLTLLMFIFPLCFSLDNGLGLTPQMGWNSWNKYGCNITEDIVKKAADAMVSSGLAQKGYEYINVDDCWQASRNSETKQIEQDKTKFPNGIKALADYVHSKGLKFGLYSDAGEKTCEGRPGSYGFQKIDATTYSKWGVDYLKYDNCYNLDISAKLRYFQMFKALNQSGRHIFYSMCNWGQDDSWQWAGPYANSWRTTQDIQDNWKSVTAIIDQQAGLQFYAGKGGWNDPDMLEVGNGGMSFDQYLAHFAFWAILKAPLLIGSSLQNMSAETLLILGNEELIAVNQDSHGIQASRIRKDIKTDGTTQIWAGELSENRFVVLFFNKGELNTQISVNIKKQLKLTYSSYAVRDILQHVSLGIKNQPQIKVSVKRHSVQVLILKLYKSEIEVYQENQMRENNLRSEQNEMKFTTIQQQSNIKMA